MESVKNENLSGKIFACANCKEAFASKKLIDEHCNSNICSVSKANEVEQYSNDRLSYSLTETSDPASDSSTEGAKISQFICAACEELFEDYKQLTLHHCAHSHKKIFSCDTCGKSFCSRVRLSSHVQIHLNKQFMCEICDKSFTSRSYLTIHMRTHTGTKPYSCDQCKKSFSQRGTLVRHMVVHRDKKPFTCRSCFEQFSDRRVYVLHLQAHLIVKQI